MTEPDDVLLADLRRIAATVDPPPVEVPTAGVHPSHDPEPPGDRILPGLVACRVCCLLIAGTRGPLIGGMRACRGPDAIELRGAE